MVDPQQIQRGSLLRIRDGIESSLGRVTVERDGRYTVETVEDASDSDRDLVPGTLAIFVGVQAGMNDAVVVLADGVLGWVFVDEVDALL